MTMIEEMRKRQGISDKPRSEKSFEHKQKQFELDYNRDLENPRILVDQETGDMSAEFSTCTGSEVTVSIACSGLKGGDAGHGGYVTLSIEEFNCFNVDLEGIDYDHHRREKYHSEVPEKGGFRMTVQGDWEMLSLRDALLFAAKALNQMIEK